ncbi:pre-peptidase [Lignipirellula cremea]|uniref:Uncharacterized protein n=1 Tax=Lignipirellula cremea TaxID=2528010 RepID=A0A518DRZ9_9BACT|nr:pre-peptidase [Lignipirellula cremea]QDU94612.1 hypothetical protein Pla8534_24050 [Lignipirellula cremea]
MARFLLPLAFCGLLLTGITYTAAAPPTANYLFPAGGSQGQVVAIQVGGEFPEWPLQAQSDRPGVAFAPDEKEKGQYQATIDKDAAPGLYWVRIYGSQGAAAPLPFVVGSTPETVETEPNELVSAAQAVASPIVINGRLQARNDVDAYAITLQAGQTLVASLAANSPLGSPMDAILQVCSTDGLVLAQNDDGAGLDPLLIYKAPRDGVCVVRMFAFPTTPNSTVALAGGEDFVYRLTLTTGPFVDHALPLTVQAGATSPTKLFGWNLAEDAAADQAIASDKAWVSSAGAAGTIALPVVDQAALLSDSVSRKLPQLIELPARISGRIALPGEEHAFRFPLVKGQKWRFEVESHQAGFPLDAVLKLYNDEGTVLAENDDRVRSKIDPSLLYAVKADGDCVLTVSDLHRDGGLRYVYRLKIEPATPDFELTLDAHGWNVAPGKTLEVPVTVVRQEGFGGEIEITASGLPEGVSAEPVVSKKGDASEKKVVLKIVASDQPGHGAFQVLGSAPATAAADAETPAPVLTHAAVFPLKGDALTSSQAWITVVKTP